MFPSNSTIQNPFADHFSSSLDENPSNFLLNFPPHLLDDDELLLGHFLQQQHHHNHDHQHQQQEQGQEQQHVPTNSGDEAAVYSALPEAAPEVKTTTEKPKRGAAKSNTNKRKEKEKAADQEAAGAEQKGTPEATATGKKKRATTARQPGAPRRRTGKKDRHSKIYTAQGPRDRRMRLSLQIARKFFDLQDMLGFDKASKTIEWLFTKSKAAIKDLTSSLPQKKNLSCGSASSATSECIGLDVMEDAHIGHVERSSSEIKNPEEDTSRRKTRNTTRKTANQQKQPQQQQNTQSTSHSHPTSLARESRDKARARARQRTTEKMLQKEMEKRKQMDDQNPTNPSNDTNNNNNNYNNLEKLGSSSTTPETTYCDESAQEFNSSIEISPPIVAEAQEKCSSSANVHQQALEHKMASVGIIEKLLGASSRSSSSIYDYTQHHQHQPMGLESMGLRSPSDHGFLGFSGHSWMAAESARMINGVTNPAGYGALMMNNGSNIMMSALQEQNPNSFFMSTSGSIYLQQPDHHHHHHNYQFLPNQFSCNNASLDGNHDPSQL